MLIAFVGLIALLNGVAGGIGGWFAHPQRSMQSVLGAVFAPLAYLIGVPLLSCRLRCAVSRTFRRSRC